MKNRGRQAVVNTVAQLCVELVAIICGLILPRLILSTFGSAYNGLTNSISQFLSYAILLRSGIGGATRAALYKPLREGDTAKVNAIMSATNRFMKRIALILAVLILLFACIYPFLVIDDFEWFFSFSLFLIIGISTIAESLLGVSNFIFLQANQKLHIPAIAHIISYISNTVISVVLLKLGFGIHVVKLGSAFAYTLYPVLLHVYVKKKYSLDYSVEPDNIAIKQRWDAFFHQVAYFVTTNTDTIVLTIFANIKEVSVYSVYNLVIVAIRKFSASFTNGLESAFGNMIAGNEKKGTEENFLIVETLSFAIGTFVFTVSSVMIVPFVMIYTRNVIDVEYARPLFAMIMVAGQFLETVRQPYQILIQAAGKYKETKVIVIIEPIINITVSIILVIRYGLVGVAIGTLISIMMRTLSFAYYISLHFIKHTFRRCLLMILLSAIESILVIFIYNMLNPSIPTTYFSWIGHAIIVSGMTIIIIFTGLYVFRKKDLLGLINKFANILHGKKHY